ncbi:MAG: pyridoxal phosphate-dependent aminotransferase [Chloroflexi bacterium]|nr:pyridoxal phosphate-dependent aminotransferase [Chloroflexota bacterium]
MSYDFDRLTDRRASNSIKWGFYPGDVLPLWVADMDFPAPAPVIEALRAAVEHGVFGYELPSPKMYEVVAQRMTRLYDWQVAPEQVVAVPGLVTGFNVAARIAAAPGDGILMQTPVYFPFLSVHENVGLVRQTAPLKPVSHGRTLRYEVDWDLFESAVHAGGARTRMFLLCNPHNPTGIAYSRADLTRMAEICDREDILICSDEIHSELLLGETQHIPIASLSPKIAARTITLVAPSKTFNVAGLFCGFAVIQDADLRERFVKEVKRLTLHVNSLGLISAQAALTGECDDWLAALNRYLTANRDFVADYVRDNLPGIRTTVPDATYLAWLDCNELIGSGKIEGSPHEFFLNEAKVALNDGATFGPGGDGFVRLNFGCPRETLVEALERMKAALATV